MFFLFSFFQRSFGRNWNRWSGVQKTSWIRRQTVVGINSPRAEQFHAVAGKRKGGNCDFDSRLTAHALREIDKMAQAIMRAENPMPMGVDTVCPRCCQLGHRSFKACGDRPPYCFICAGPHEGAEHVCRVVDCPAKPGTACQHIPAKCGTCGGSHPATAGNCPAKREARKELRKRSIKSKTISQPIEDSQPMTNQEPAIPSSPWFTVVNRD